MEHTPAEKKHTSLTSVLIKIAAAILVPLFTVWYLDRENRINDLKEQNSFLRAEVHELKDDCKKKDARTEYWIDKYIGCERQIPEIIDTLKARTKRQKDE